MFFFLGARHVITLYVPLAAVLLFAAGALVGANALARVPAKYFVIAEPIAAAFRKTYKKPLQ